MTWSQLRAAGVQTAGHRTANTPLCHAAVVVWTRVKSLVVVAMILRRTACSEGYVRDQGIVLTGPCVIVLRFKGEGSKLRDQLYQSDRTKQERIGSTMGVDVCMLLHVT